MRPLGAMRAREVSLGKSSGPESSASSPTWLVPLAYRGGTLGTVSRGGRALLARGVLLVPDAVDDLRATADSLLTDAERLARLEERKLGLDPTDPAAVELSREIEDLTEQIRREAIAEREIVEEIQEGNKPEKAPEGA